MSGIIVPRCLYCGSEVPQEKAYCDDECRSLGAAAKNTETLAEYEGRLEVQGFDSEKGGPILVVMGPDGPIILPFE